MLEFRVLGPMNVLEDGRLLEIRGQKQRALLALLLLARNAPVTNEALVARLWDGAPPRDAEAVLRIHVSKLRRSLGETFAARLATRPRGYELRVEPDELDLERFEQLAEDGRHALEDGEAQEAARTLRAAIDLWRGDPLADLVGEPFVAIEGGRMTQLHHDVVLRWADAELALGRPETVIGELERHALAEPYQERFAARLMVALYRAGRQADALTVYQRTRARFVEELGIEPARELRDLERAILRHDRSLDPPAAPRPAPTRSRRRYARFALVGATVAAATVAVALSAAETRSPGLAFVAANSVGVIDGHTNQITAQVRVGRKPVALATSEGKVWVANAGDDTLSEFDPTRGQLIRTLGLSATPSSLAVVAKQAWVATATRGARLIELGPDGDVSTFAAADPGGMGRAAQVAVGFGRIWLADGDSRVFPLRVSASSFAHPIDVPNGYGVPGGQLVAAAGAIWVADPHGNEVSRVDPSSGATTATISLGRDTGAGGGATGLAAGHGSVWAVAPNAPKLWRIDPQANTVADVIHLGHSAVAVAVGSDAAWVATSDGHVVRVSISTDRVTARIRVGGTPTAIATAGAHVFVAVT